jgi:hypothetical protein
MRIAFANALVSPNASFITDLFRQCFEDILVLQAASISTGQQLWRDFQTTGRL